MGTRRNHIPKEICCPINKIYPPALSQSKVDAKMKEGCCHHYDSSKLKFVDQGSPGKKYNEISQQITHPPTSVRHFPNGHKTNDPQIKWSRNNIAMTMEYFEPISSTSTPIRQYGSQADYSYAYYEPGAAMRHSNIPATDKLSGSSILSSPKSIRSLLSRTKNDVNKSKSNNRHTYTTRYGTQENIYEDVSSIGKRLDLESSVQSLNEQSCTKTEFQNILHNHYRVLEELNLSVEELLLSTTPKKNILSRTFLKLPSKPCVKARKPETLNAKRNFHTSMNEVMVGEDSGFSGSSSGASYIGSLRNYKTALTRSLRNSSENNTANGCGNFQDSTNVKLPYDSRKDSLHMINQLQGEKSSDSSKSLKFSFWNKR